MAAIAAIGLTLFFGATPSDSLLVEQQFFGSFENATRIATARDGGIYVIDQGRESILSFRGPGLVAKTVGGYGWEATTFDRPTGIVSDGLTTYVSDYGNHRIIRYDRNFVFLSSLSTRDTSFAPAQFGYPLGVSLSRQGDLFVLDGENLRVVEFDSRSRFLRSFGTIESREGRLHQPVEMEVTNDDRVVILETDRIVEFDYAGNYVRSVGEGLLKNATGMAATEKGFFVTANDTLYWFNLDGTVRMKIPSSTILAQFPLVPLRDVAVRGDRILLLSSTRVGVFALETAVR